MKKHTAHDSAKATQSHRRFSPLCESQWPNGQHADFQLDRVHEAVNGAIFLAWILEADKNIHSDIADFENESDSPAPLSPAYRGGLMSALNICLHVAMLGLESDARDSSRTTK